MTLRSLAAIVNAIICVVICVIVLTQIGVGASSVRQNTKEREIYSMNSNFMVPQQGDATVRFHSFP